jgi:spermidine dehydrogenase
MFRDEELGMNRRITRRDFLNGSLVCAATARQMSAAARRGIFPQDQEGYYPPALMGLRGSHDGAFEIAHQLRDSMSSKGNVAAVRTGERYDLVVAGAGISGLSAAYFYRQRFGRHAKILLLDNHDDFGGHAKRNEFNVAKRRLITYGGTISIESPFPYSRVAQDLMATLAIDPVQLSAETKKLARRPFRGLKSAVFFDKEAFGADSLVVGIPRLGREGEWKEFLAKTPLALEVQRDILRLEAEEVDYLPGLSSAEKKEILSRMSYRNFLTNVVKVNHGVLAYYQRRPHGLFGVGIDAINALDCWALHYPGFGGMNLEPGVIARMGFTARGEATPQTPYNFHFPDGNASIARAMVRLLWPSSASGHTAQDIVTAKFDYRAFDRPDSSIRMRFGSTMIGARHHGEPGSARSVDLSYARAKAVYQVSAKHVVLACWNMVIPYLCPELPSEQKEALKYGVKVPLVYTAVALRDWKAFERLGIRHVATPGMYHSEFHLEEPTTIGDYRASPSTSGEPVIVRMERTPCKAGLSERDQHHVGQHELLTTPFSSFERNVREQLARVLGAGGFDPARDIDAIVVNRWPHGYAYEYNHLFDPEWPKGERPCDVARRCFGRIAIANSDAAAAAYTDQAIDQAFRAVQDLPNP